MDFLILLIPGIIGTQTLNLPQQSTLRKQFSALFHSSFLDFVASLYCYNRKISEEVNNYYTNGFT
jgi:hypothetical protein